MDREKVKEKILEFLKIPSGEDHYCCGWEWVVHYALYDVPNLYQVFFDLQDFGAISYYLDKSMRCEGISGEFDAYMLVPFGSDHFNVAFCENVSFNEVKSEKDLVELIAGLQMRAREVRSELGYKHITLEEIGELKSKVPSICPNCGEDAIELQANSVSAGERLRLTDDLDLYLVQDADAALVDEVWGWICADCFHEGSLDITYRVES